jgi:hypothetical protein
MLLQAAALVANGPANNVAVLIVKGQGGVPACPDSQFSSFLSPRIR